MADLASITPASSVMLPSRVNIALSCAELALTLVSAPSNSMLPFSEYIAAMAAVVEALTLLPPLMVTPLSPEMAVPPVVFTVTRCV